MSGIIVSEKAVRDLIKEIFSSDWSNSEEESPVNVSHVVDLSAALTNPGDENYVPNNKIELQVAIKALSDDLSQDSVPDVYEKFINAIEKDKDDKKMKKDIKVENFIRLKIRKMLQEATPVRMPGVLGSEEKIASAEEVKAWRPGIGMPAPSGYEVVTGKKGKETLQLKAVMPAGLKPTVIPPGASGVADKRIEKYKSKLQTSMGKMKDLDFPEEQATEQNLKDWLGTIVSVNDAMKYKEAYIEAYKQNNEEQNEFADWSMTTESPAFEKLFKQSFASTFRTYCLPVGRKIKDRLTSSKNYSAADIGAEGVADELAAEFGVSRSQLKNIEDQTLAKFALGMIAEMPTEEEANAGLGSAVVEGSNKLVESYIKILAARGDITKADVRILRENPEFIVDLPGFREYIKRNL